MIVIFYECVCVCVTLLNFTYHSTTLLAVLVSYLFKKTFIYAPDYNIALLSAGRINQILQRKVANINDGRKMVSKFIMLYIYHAVILSICNSAKLQW